MKNTERRDIILFLFQTVDALDYGIRAQSRTEVYAQSRSPLVRRGADKSTV